MRRHVLNRTIAAIDAAGKAALAVAALLLAFIGVIMLAEIAARSIIGRGLLFSWDLASYSLAIAIFLAAPFTLLTGGHIRVGVLAGLGNRMGRILDLGSTSVGLIGSAFVTVVLCDLSYSSFVHDSRSATALRLPLAYPQAAMAFGAMLLTLQFAARLMRLAAGLRPDEPFGEPDSAV